MKNYEYALIKALYLGDNTYTVGAATREELRVFCTNIRHWFIFNIEA